MSEIRTPLERIGPWDSYTAKDDGAYVIDERHTHSDILRYVVSDIGRDEAILLLQMIEFPELRQPTAGQSGEEKQP